MESKKVKKRGGCLKSLLIFILIIVLIIAGGVIFFRIQQPKDVTYTQSDVDSFYSKMTIEPGDYAFGIIDFMNGNLAAEGTKEIDATFTSEEITAGIQSASAYISGIEIPEERALLANPFVLDALAQENISGVESYGMKSIFGKVNFRFTGPDQMEIFATPSEGFRIIYDYAPELTDYEMAVDRVIGAKLYVKLTMTYSNGWLYLDATEATLNGIPVPMVLIDQYEGDLVARINHGLNSIEGLDIEIMAVTEDGFRFKGTVPARVRNIAE